MGASLRRAEGVSKSQKLQIMLKMLKNIGTIIRAWMTGCSNYLHISKQHCFANFLFLLRFRFVGMNSCCYQWGH